MENNNNNQSLLNRFLPASSQQRPGLYTWTQIIDILIGFFLVVPHLDGMRGFFPILLALLAIIVAA